MTEQSFTMTLVVDHPPEEVFAAVTNVRGWWSRDVTGSGDREGAEFDYHYEDLHRTRIRVVEVVPNRRVEWLVLTNHFAFTEDQTEWAGTRITFEIAGTQTGAELVFTHHGLVPAHECFTVCDNAWRFYVGTSLHALITTGEGLPNTGAVNHVPPLAGAR